MGKSLSLGPSRPSFFLKEIAGCLQRKASDFVTGGKAVFVCGVCRAGSLANGGRKGALVGGRIVRKQAFVASLGVMGWWA